MSVGVDGRGEGCDGGVGTGLIQVGQLAPRRALCAKLSFPALAGFAGQGDRPPVLSVLCP